MTKKKQTKEAKQVTKISNDHLSKLQDLVSSSNRTTIAIGNLEMKKFQAIQDLEVLDSKLLLLQKELEEEYGTSNVNIQDGTIINHEQVN